jgi:hypothetical protein
MRAFTILIYAAAAITTAIFTQQANAFCVGQDAIVGNQPYFHVQGPPGKHFQAQTKSGEKSCCNWQEKSCNPKQKRDALVPLTVFQATGTRDAPIRSPNGPEMTAKIATGPVCRVEMEAGGSARARNEGGGLLVVVYNINGSKRSETRCENADVPFLSMR